MTSTPRARSTDPDTSHSAARTVSNTAQVQGAVLALLGTHGPMTDQQIATLYPPPGAPWSSASGLRTRRAELVTAGLAYDTGRRAPTESGRSSIVWAAGFDCPGCGLRPVHEAGPVDDDGDTWCLSCYRVVTG